MEFLVIVLFVVAIVVVNFVITRAQRRKKHEGGEPLTDGGTHPDGEAKPQRAPRKRAAGAAAAPAASRTSVEAAREANARLDAVQHQQVYAAIAQGQPIKAVKLYAQFTGLGVRASGAAVENLATHPQPHQPPRPASAEPAAGGSSAAPSPEAGQDAVDSSAPDSRANPAVNKDDIASKPGSSPKQDSTPDQDSTQKPGSTPDPDSTPDSDSTETPGSTPKSGPTATPNASTAAGAPRQGPDTGPPAEDEISNWVKNLRPEDF